MNGKDHGYQENEPYNPNRSYRLESGHESGDHMIQEKARLDPEPDGFDIALEIPSSELDLDLSAIIGPSETSFTETDKVQKRASNVLKLSQEHEKLKEELRAMTERLEAAERKQKEFMTRRKGTRGGNPN